MRTHLSVYPTGALLCNEGGSLREKKEKTKMRGRRGGEEGERGVNFHTQAVLPSAVLNVWEARQCGLDKSLLGPIFSPSLDGTGPPQWLEDGS